MILNAERLAVWDSCQRRAVWQDRYQLPRISIMAALYRALDAGLRSESNPARAAENEFLALAANPGLAIFGRDTYAVAMHHAKLVGIVAYALRSAFTAPWKPFGGSDVVFPDYGQITWRSALYDAGNGIPRRVALVDRWSDDRKESELRSWRTLGEVVMLKRPILVTAVTIGASKDGRRHSPWTKCYLHPKNRTFRFKRKVAAEDFGANWLPEWRENSETSNETWLTQMQRDDCMTEAVQTVEVTMHPRRADFEQQIRRMVADMKRVEERIGETPPMRMAGCYAFTPCPFLSVCFGAKAAVAELHGFVRIADAKTPAPPVPAKS